MISGLFLEACNDIEWVETGFLGYKFFIFSTFWIEGEGRLGGIF